MMNSINYAVVRSVCAIVIGVLLVVWPDVAINYLVISIGVLFLLPGLYGLFSYFALARKQEGQQIRVGFPLIALGSTLFGFWLMISPAFFVGILMYILGVLLVFGGLSQLMNFITLRSVAPLPFAVYIIPTLILAAGIVVLFDPFEAATIPFIILGIAGIVYGSTEIIRMMKCRKRLRELGIEIVDVPIE